MSRELTPEEQQAWAQLAHSVPDRYHAAPPHMAGTQALQPKSLPFTQVIAVSPRPGIAPQPPREPLQVRDRKQVERGFKLDLPVDATIDLHGHTQSMAHARLQHFLETQHQRGARHLSIITGKGLHGDGQGILRQLVPEWISAMPIGKKVSLLTVAPEHRGGQGVLELYFRNPHRHRDRRNDAHAR